MTNFKKNMSELFDPIRKQNFKNSPEEIVRQQTISWMIENGYNSHYIVCEKKIAQQWLKNHQKWPKRRLDILYVHLNEDGQIAPWLLIECKAHPIKSSDLQQVCSYNFFIKARLIACVGTEGTCWSQDSGQSWKRGLPTYLKNP